MKYHALVVGASCFSLLCLNLPYDSEIGSVANRRTGAVFLEHTYRCLASEAVLVFVISFERLADCAGILSFHFAALIVFRLTDRDFVQYRQIVVLGVRGDVLPGDKMKTMDDGKLERIGIYFCIWQGRMGDTMQRTAKIFMNNRSQAVRLPKEFQFETEEVFIRKRGSEVILSARPENWFDFLTGGPVASENFMKGIEDLPVQERDL
jgi:antitoxin VapB